MAIHKRLGSMHVGEHVHTHAHVHAHTCTHVHTSTQLQLSSMPHLIHPPIHPSMAQAPYTRARTIICRSAPCTLHSQAAAHSAPPPFPSYTSASPTACLLRGCRLAGFSKSTASAEGLPTGATQFRPRPHVHTHSPYTCRSAPCTSRSRAAERRRRAAGSARRGPAARAAT